MAKSDDLWTGGHYSLYRVLLSVGIAQLVWMQTAALGSGAADFAGGEAFWASEPVLVATRIAAAIACAGLALGWLDVLASIVLIVLLDAQGPLLATPDDPRPAINALIGTSLLLLHLIVLWWAKEAPFGAWSARERPDPAGEWRTPGWLPTAAWVGWVGFGLLLILSEMGASSDPAGERPLSGVGVVTLAFHGIATLALFVPGLRKSAWLALGTLGIAMGHASGIATHSAPLWVFQALAFSPHWLPGRRHTPSPESTSASDAPPRLFYDGECGLCHRSVRLLLAEQGDSGDAQALRFAPLQGETFEAWAATKPELDVDALPDSIVLACEDGTVLTRSSAAIELARRLGGIWKAVGATASFLPESIRDGLYDGVAAVRKSIFAKPKDSCPILPPHLRARFDL